MKPRTTTSDVTAPPEQSQLEVCNIEDEIGILHCQLDSGMCSTISTLPNGEDATITRGEPLYCTCGGKSNVIMSQNKDKSRLIAKSEQIAESKQIADYLKILYFHT